MLTPEQEKARLRPFRSAAYGVHVVFTAAFCILLTLSVLHSVRAMTPTLPPQPEQLATVKDCAWRGERLWVALEEARRGMSELRGGVRLAHEHWSAFRLEWMRNLRTAQAECGVSTPERAGLRKVFRDLEGLEDLYTTHAVQYGGEVGPAVERFEADLGAARGTP